MRLTPEALAAVKANRSMTQALIDSFNRARVAEVAALASAPLAQVQVYQGRVQMLDIILAELAR